MLSLLAITVALAPVESGLDVLRANRFADLKGKKVGLITNPTGVDRAVRSNIDLMIDSGVKLVALYGPEHGVRGSVPAGVYVENGRDPKTGVPEYSLYGKTRKPTAEMLRGVDALVFDIQDIGSRSYTYISTLGVCMEAAAENNLPLYVLDRPNPIGGDRVEGNITEDGFKSFVSAYPVPYCHGLTIGEFARMANGEGWLKGKKCDLKVISMKGWKRSMTWAETGLPWVLTSPHVPHASSAAYYAATGIFGELDTVSIGVGYTLPFELAGAPGIGAESLANEMNRRKLPGVFFRPMTWTPFYAAFKGQSCGGVNIYFTDERKVELSRINFELMDAFRKLKPDFDFFKPSTSNMFDKVCGNGSVRSMFSSGQSASAIWQKWNSGAAGFRTKRAKYLLY